MSNLNEDYVNESWKLDLRSRLISGISESGFKRAISNFIIKNYYLKDAPKFLYKYYSDKEQCFENVKNNKMWYSAPIQFNDVFDCDISIDEKSCSNNFIEYFSKYKPIRKGSKEWKDIKSKIHSSSKEIIKTFDELKETTGVTCLSESYNSLLMWSHYASNHSGICVKYKLGDIVDELKFSPVPVIYSQERASIDKIDLGNNSYFEQLACKSIVESVTSKSLEWQYEKEWRIVRDEGACGDRWDSAKKGALLDMIRPTAIYLGCMATQTTETKIKEYCKSQKINLYKMEKDPNEYKLNEKEVLNFDK